MKMKGSVGVNIYLDGSEILNGYFPVFLALESQLRQIYRLFITNQRLSRRQERVVELASEKGVPVQYVDSRVLSQLTRREDKERGVHQGICADVSCIPLKRIPGYSVDPAPRTDVLLCGINDPFNVGSILRSSYFLGINDVLICEEFKSARLSPVVSKASKGLLLYEPKVQQLSSGTLEVHPPKLIENPLQYLGECIQSEGRVIALDSARGNPPEKKALEQQLSRHNKILLLGNEALGIPQELSRLISDFVKIPPGRELHPQVDSLNVSTASAILMHELVRMSS